MASEPIAKRRKTAYMRVFEKKRAERREIVKKKLVEMWHPTAEW